MRRRLPGLGRQQARLRSAEQRVEPLPVTHWTLFQSVRWPGRPVRRIDEVLVGPSGVHVVLHRPGQLTSTAVNDDGTDLGEAVGCAAAAALAVADLLPGRYRRAVMPAVCLTGTVDVGLHVGAVAAASPGILRHSWRHQPRVLSTSEVHAIARILRAGLEPFPVEPRRSPPRNTRRRWRRLWLANTRKRPRP